jgi:virginiamycin B lyase
MNARLRLAAGLLCLALGACHTGNNGYVPPAKSPFTVQSAFTTGITAGANVSGLTGGPDGRIWFSQFQTPFVGAMTTSGTVSQYAVLTNSQTNGIVTGPDGNLWTGGYGGRIYKITTAGATTIYTVPGAHYAGIAVGSDGNLWLGDYGNNKLTRITTAGAYTQFPLPAGVTCTTVASGSDGNLWYACNTQVLKVATTGTVIAQYTAGISTGQSLQYIIAAPDGNLYATEYAASATINDKISKITTTGGITEIGTLPPESYPNQLAVGSDNNVYFQEVNKALLGRITLSSGVVTTGSIALSNGDSGTQSIGSVNGLLYVGGKQTIYAVQY